MRLGPHEESSLRGARGWAASWAFVGPMEPEVSRPVCLRPRAQCLAWSQQAATTDHFTKTPQDALAS